MTKAKGMNLRRAVKIAFVAFAIYACFAIFQQQVQISQKKQELNTVLLQCQAQELKNVEMQQVLDSNDSDEYIEQIARRDYDYVKSNERVYMNIAGN